MKLAKSILEIINKRYFILLYLLLEKGCLPNDEITRLSEIQLPALEKHKKKLKEKNVIIDELPDLGKSNFFTEEFGSYIAILPEPPYKVKVYSTKSEDLVFGIVLTPKLLKNRSKILVLFNKLCQILCEIGEYF